MMQEREGYITTVLNVLLKDALAVKRFLCKNIQRRRFQQLHPVFVVLYTQRHTWHGWRSCTKYILNFGITRFIAHSTTATMAKAFLTT
jgi:hypothetical protein